MHYACLITDIDALFLFGEKSTPRANLHLLDFLKDHRHEVITLFVVSKELKISFDKEDKHSVYLHKETDDSIKYCLKFPWEISKECFIYSIKKELKSSPLATEQFIIISSDQLLLDTCEKLGCNTQITFWEGTLEQASLSKLKEKLDSLDENSTEIEFIYDIDETISMHGASKDEDRAVTNEKLNTFLKPYINKFNQAIHSILTSRPNIFKAFSIILTELKQRAAKANIKISELDNLEITYEINMFYIIINKLIGACNELSKNYLSDLDYDPNSDPIFGDMKEALKKNDDQLLHHSSSFMILREFQEQTGIKLVLNESSFTGGKIPKKSIVEKKHQENPKKLLVVFEDLPKNIADLIGLDNVIGVQIMREDHFKEPLKEKLSLIKEREISNSQGDEEIDPKPGNPVYDSEFDISTLEMIKPGKELEDANQRFANHQPSFFKKNKKRKRHQEEKASVPEVIVIDVDAENSHQPEPSHIKLDATF